MKRTIRSSDPSQLTSAKRIELKSGHKCLDEKMNDSTKTTRSIDQSRAYDTISACTILQYSISLQGMVAMPHPALRAVTKTSMPAASMLGRTFPCACSCVSCSGPPGRTTPRHQCRTRCIGTPRSRWPCRSRRRRRSSPVLSVMHPEDQVLYMGWRSTGIGPG